MMTCFCVDIDEPLGSVTGNFFTSCLTVKNSGKAVHH